MQKYSINCPSQWSSGLGCGYATARLLRLWVPIPLACMDICTLWLLCTVK
jgi:hypothetical protein